MKLGEQIKLARIAQNMTRAKLAELSDVSFTMVTKIERCERMPSLPVFQRIIKALGMSLGDFDGDD